ncbi:MAG: hypothetical protein JO164_12710 [Candidatus Eremiobacteraeota bacterium]|nr:hypothetical protein [Candidatus Eremiobacteraeota bacterium]
MYVAYGGFIGVYALPLKTGSAPIARIPYSGIPATLAVDGAGDIAFAGASAPSGITIIQNALSGSPSSMNIAPSSATIPVDDPIVGLTFDAAGDLWAMALGPTNSTFNGNPAGTPFVVELKAPLSAASTTALQVSAGMTFVPEPLGVPPASIAFDQSGNLNVLVGNPTYGTVIYQYAPPYTALAPNTIPLSSAIAVPANPIPIDATGGTYLSRSASGGVATTALQVLYYAGPLVPPSTSLGSNVAGGVGTPATPALQFTATSFSVSSRAIAVNGIAEDASGDLILGLSDGTLSFFSAPLSTSSSASATVACPLGAVSGTCDAQFTHGIGALALGP